MMLVGCKRGEERAEWQRFNKMIVFLVAAIVLFATSGISAQEKPAGSVSVSSEQVISLNVNQMDLQDVLRLIAEKADLNIIMGKEVTGMVTLRLKNVNLWQALEAILEVNGFTYREKGEIIRVVKLGKVAEEKLKVEEKPTLVTKIVGLKYAKAEDIKEASQHLLSSSGIMKVDTRSNSLIITDTPQNIKKIRQLIAKLDTGTPEFNLKGILSAPDYPLAMINDRILRKGESIEGFTVSEIGEDSVSLKKEDKIITLRLREKLHAREK